MAPWAVVPLANWWLGRIKYSPSDDLRGSKSIFPPSAAIELVEKAGLFIEKWQSVHPTSRSA